MASGKYDRVPLIKDTYVDFHDSAEVTVTDGTEDVHDRFLRKKRKQKMYHCMWGVITIVVTVLILSAFYYVLEATPNSDQTKKNPGQTLSTASSRKQEEDVFVNVHEWGKDVEDDADASDEWGANDGDDDSYDSYSSEDYSSSEEYGYDSSAEYDDDYYNQMLFGNKSAEYEDYYGDSYDSEENEKSKEQGEDYSNEDTSDLDYYYDDEDSDEQNLSEPGSYKTTTPPYDWYNQFNYDGGFSKNHDDNIAEVDDDADDSQYNDDDDYANSEDDEEDDYSDEDYEYYKDLYNDNDDKSDLEESGDVTEDINSNDDRGNNNRQVILQNPSIPKADSDNQNNNQYDLLNQPYSNSDDSSLVHGQIKIDDGGLSVKHSENYDVGNNVGNIRGSEYSNQGVSNDNINIPATTGDVNTDNSPNMDVAGYNTNKNANDASRQSQTGQIAKEGGTNGVSGEVVVIGANSQNDQLTNNPQNSCKECLLRIDPYLNSYTGEALTHQMLQLLRDDTHRSMCSLYCDELEKMNI